MSTLVKTSIALSLMLAYSAGPYTASAKERPDLSPTPTQTAPGAFDNAKALAPAFRLRPGRDARGPETDGLGRNDDDCKFGCIDH